MKSDAPPRIRTRRSPRDGRRGEGVRWMDERKQLTLSKEVTFARGEKIEVIVRLSGDKENGYRKMIPIAKTLFDEVIGDAENSF